MFLFSVLLNYFLVSTSFNLSKGKIKWDYINVLNQACVCIFLREGFKIMKHSIYHLLNQKQGMCILSDSIVERKMNNSRYMLPFSNKMPTLLWQNCWNKMSTFQLQMILLFFKSCWTFKVFWKIELWITLPKTFLMCVTYAPI